jgi:hypothetical protein
MADQPSESVYRVITTQTGPDQWEWEILRYTRPLGVRVREGSFKSERTAMLAGAVALREFLELLEKEQDDE